MTALEMLKRNSAAAAAAVFAFALAGCWTVHHSPYPDVEMTSVRDAGGMRVAVAGFEATVTSYVPVRTYSTAWGGGGGYYRRGRHYHDGYYPTTVTSTTYIPQTSETTVFAEQATEILETSGFIVSPSNAEYVVEAHFAQSPIVTNGDRTKEVLCVVLSLLTADYTARTWGAKLSIRETATGKLVFHKEYSLRGSAAVWGPIPILSPAAADETSPEELRGWCFAALTDMAMADATAFLASRGGGK